MSSAPNLNRLRYLTAVVEAGSFTAAADRLGVAKTVVSHQVAQLEAELSTTLLVRSTRKVQLAESGRRFYVRAAAILGDAEAAFGEIAQTAVEPSGTLTITAPVEYGQTVVAPTITAFVERFPLMNVEVKFTDKLVDLVTADVDIAVRLGWLADSSNPMRRLGSFRQLLVCSPSFAKDLPADPSPGDLTDVRWVGNRVLKRPLQWVFERDGEQVELIAKGVVMADTTPATMSCVAAGAGISVLPDFLVVPEIRAGRLVRLLGDWSLPEGGIHIVFPNVRFRPAKVRRFLEMLVEAERERARSA